MKIKVSVCIPVYNGEKYIYDTIKSVLDQTFSDFELLIVDNCSMDHTLDIVEKFHDERIRIVKNDRNYGMVGNWNICLNEAIGECVQFLCADDLLEPECLEKKYRTFKQDKNIVMVISATNIINENNKLLIKRRQFRKNCLFEGQQLAKKSFRLKNLYGEPSNVMFSNKTSHEIGGFTEGMPYSPDWEYWLRLSSQGRVAYIDEPLVCFRVAETSTTSNLFKARDKLKMDDELLIDNIRKNKDLHISSTDILLHRISNKLILCLKMLFFTLKKTRR